MRCHSLFYRFSSALAIGLHAPPVPARVAALRPLARPPPLGGGAGAAG
jgi:hypothetical protein